MSISICGIVISRQRMCPNCGKQKNQPAEGEERVAKLWPPCMYRLCECVAQRHTFKRVEPGVGRISLCISWGARPSRNYRI